MQSEDDDEEEEDEKKTQNQQPHYLFTKPRVHRARWVV